MSTTIRRVSHLDILRAPNAAELLAEYAAECSIHDAAPQHEQYAAMEAAGALQCFGVYYHSLDDPILIGFVSVLSAILPHAGRRMSTVESIFVAKKFRGSAAGRDLMFAAERHAEEINSIGLTYLPRIGSALEKLLIGRHNCVPTHTQYTLWLSGAMQPRVM